MLDKVKEAFDHYPQLRVLFFFDTDNSHAEDLDNWDDTATGITLLKGSNRYFSLKHTLHYDLKDKRVFLYLPFAKPTGEAWHNFPLRSLFHTNRELKLDDIATFMADFHLPRHTRDLVKRYESELKKKQTQNVLATILTADAFTPDNLKRGLIALALGFNRVADRTLCLAKLLILGAQEGKLERPLSKIEELGLTDELKHWIYLTFDKSLTDLNETSIQTLACQLKYNLLVNNTLSNDNDTYAPQLGLKNLAQFNYLLAFYEEWQHDRHLAEDLGIVLNDYARDVDELKLIAWYGTGHAFGYFTPRMIGALLHHAKEEITFNPAKVREDIPTLRERMSAHPQLLPYLDLLENAAHLFDLLKQYNGRYAFNTADIFIETYTNELWKIDFHYRKAIFAFGKLEVIARHEATEGVNPFDFYALKDLMNVEYDRYLIELNREWLALLKETHYDWRSLKVEKQYDFYDTHIRPLTGKIAVIISDAFRYEAAQDLVKQLQRTSKNEVEISPMLASLPSITKIGMANLLPRHKGIDTTYDDTKNVLNIRIGGVSTEGVANRRTILKQATEQSEAISDVDLLKMNKVEGRAFFNLKNDDAPKIVYIYHNEIDSVGDVAKSENRTFEAVESTIAQLQKMLSYLNNFNVYQIWITADHGFIFNERALKDVDREDPPKDIGEIHSRFVMGKTGAIQLSATTDWATDLKLTLPNTTNRFRKQGSGAQYVHGGASLQELIVPVIRYSHARIDKSTSVKVRLHNEETLKIESGALRLLFLQEQPIGNLLKPSKWAVGLYDMSGIKRLSTEEIEVTFDSDSATPSARMKTLTLRLNTEGSRSNFCYLYIYDVLNDKGRLNPKVKKRIDVHNLMEIDDF